MLVSTFAKMPISVMKLGHAHDDPEMPVNNSLGFKPVAAINSGREAGSVMRNIPRLGACLTSTDWGKGGRRRAPRQDHPSTAACAKVREVGRS